MAFKDIDVAILVGSMPRREGMERKDLIKANTKIFESQGKALDQCAKKTVKVGGHSLETIQWVGGLVVVRLVDLAGFICYFAGLRRVSL